MLVVGADAWGRILPTHDRLPSLPKSGNAICASR